MWFFAAAAALAYETDQITERLVPLEDAAEVANAEMDRLLAEAVRNTNEATRCEASEKATRRRLAHEIYKVTAHPERVESREGLSELGHGAYAAWLESAPEVDRRAFLDRTDIYGHLRPRQALVLGTAGVCSTVNIAGVLMGTDKPDHFLAQGYDYLKVSRFGKNAERAIRWGTRTEVSAFGLLTSNTFSWADLYANWQGFSFYEALLEEGSAFERGEDGCVTQARPWSWAEWLDDAADEALNPPIYTKDVGEAVRLRFQENRSAVCADYAVWAPGLASRRAEIIERERAHASPDAPPRVDEWGLDELCAPEIAEARARKVRPTTAGASTEAAAPSGRAP